MLPKNSLTISHNLIKSIVEYGDTVVDATAGNGNDTVFLASLIGDRGKVYAFDIQDIAIKNTKKKLEERGWLNRADVIKDGHQNIDKYIHEKVKAVMFNLGYLPKGDHNIATKAESTIEAINKCLNLLCIGGIITIVIYYGGDSGFEEKDQVLKYLETLDYKKYSVLVHQFVNQINCPPIAACIEKLFE